MSIDYDTLTKTPLWEHQKRMVDFALNRPNSGSMLAADMGTGKTLATIAILAARNHKRILVASPISVVPVWGRQIPEHAREPYNVLMLDRGSVKEKAEQAHLALRIAMAQRERGQKLAIIINHESLWRPPFDKVALSQMFDCIVLDESARGKSHTGKLGRFLMELSKRYKHKLALTGTPTPHSPLDLFNQFRFIDPNIFGWRHHPFKMRYSVLGGFQNKQIIAYQHTEELNEKFLTAAIRITKEEALDLPEEVPTERICTLEPRAARIYSDLDRQFYAEVEDGSITAANALVKLLRLQQLTSGYLQLDGGGLEEVSEAKAKLLEDILQDIFQPIVVFTRFTADLETVRDTAERLDRRYGEVSGRRKDLDAGRYPDGVDILGINIQAGGLGIDLTRASTSIFFSCGFSLGDYRQACARLHRPGQVNKVTHIHLIAEGTIDRRVFRAIKNKEDIIKSIFEHRPNSHDE
jgi:SNF2 family DNA or RNA helicase